MIERQRRSRRLTPLGRLPGPPRPGFLDEHAVHRVLLLPLVIAITAGLVAVALLPAFAGAGAAITKFDQTFLGQDTGPVDLPPFPQRSTIFAADGSVLATVADENRSYLPLGKIAPIARDAVIAIEDHGFYEHGPVDAVSIFRAALANLKAGHVVQGGSTISQQLVKNTEVGDEQTFSRKFKEAQAAIKLESQYSKDKILELYLNEVYFGNGAYGIRAASEFYFGREPSTLTVPQSAMIAGLIAAPSTFDPVDHKDAAKVRRNQVLTAMHQYGYITNEQLARASAAPVKLSTKLRGRVNTLGPQPYFVQYVKDSILHPDLVFPKGDPQIGQYERAFGATYAERAKALFQGGLKIYTTLQPALQKAAADSVQAHLPNPGVKPPADPEAAVVTMVPDTGAIQVMYGGQDFSKQQFNLATQARRTAGSSFKAFTLAAAFEQGVPVGKVYDTTMPVDIPSSKCYDPSGKWEPGNADPAEGGLMNMTTATALSVNVYFAQLIADLGPQSVVDVAKQMGVVGYARDAGVSITPVCSITLGAVQVNPLSMTAGYATLANNGVRCLPFAVRKVVTSSGKQLFETKPICKQAIDPGIAAQVTALLQGVIEFGTAARTAQIGRPAAGKTGTGQDYQDAWFLGYVPQEVTGVWVGYSSDEIPMRNLPVLGYANAFGGTIAAPIWRDVMVAAVNGLPVETFPTPPPPKAGTVPDVTGKTQAEAQTTLSAANFTSIVTEVDSKLPAGIVDHQSPAGGSTVPLGSAVTIFVSNGKAPVVVPTVKTVPSVIGSSEPSAVALLKRDGFGANVVYQGVQDRSQDGVVLSQTPQAGSKAKVGTTVTLVVGRFQQPSPSPSKGKGKGKGG